MHACTHTHTHSPRHEDVSKLLTVQTHRQSIWISDLKIFPTLYFCPVNSILLSLRIEMVYPLDLVKRVGALQNAPGTNKKFNRV